MALVEINWRPARKQLRDFGEGALAMLVLIGIVGYVFDRLVPAWSMGFCAAGLVIYGLSRLHAGIVKPIYLVLMVGAFPIGWVMSHVVLGLFYFAILTPIGLLFRLIGRDVLDRRWHLEASSYWVKHKPTDSAKRYFHQF